MVAEQVAHQDGLRQVVDLVAVLPVDPDVFDADVARVAHLPHDVEDASVVDDVLLERRLEPARPGASGVEVAGVGDQGFHLGVGEAAPGEVGVIQRQRQPGDRLHEPGGGLGRRDDRADVGLDGEA